MPSTHKVIRNENGISKIDYTFEESDGQLNNGSLYRDKYIYNKDRNFPHKLRDASGAYGVFVNDLYDQYFKANGY